jgi:hypothetical protein
MEFRDEWPSASRFEQSRVFNECHGGPASWRSTFDRGRLLIAPCASGLVTIPGQTTCEGQSERCPTQKPESERVRGPLSRMLAEFSAHYHGERNHQGKGNKLLLPNAGDQTKQRGHAVACHQRLGGLLKLYRRVA